MTITQAIRNFRRLAAITNILTKNGFHYIIEQTKLKKYSIFTKKHHEYPKEHIQVRLRNILEELGGTFIKLGQLLSLRYDLLPKEYCEELSKLQDNVNPLPFQQVKQVIEAEYNKPINNIFKTFSKTPIASASIGQVHKAKLHNNQTVAVKVQRPGIRDLFKTDIDLLYHLASLLEDYLLKHARFSPTQLVKEFEDYTEKELDYLIEARNIDAFYRHFEHDKTIKIPKVFWEHTTSKVLVMEYIPGKKLSVIKQYSSKQRKHVCQTLLECFYKQVFRHHTFHADMHPGNIFLIKNKIALLDYGIVGRVTPETINYIHRFFNAIIQGNSLQLASVLKQICTVEQSINTRALSEDITERLGYYYNIPLSKANLSKIFNEIFAIAREYNLKFPKGFVLLTKGMITVEGVCLEFCPNFNFVQALRDILKKDKSSIKEFKSTIKKFTHTINTMPHNIRLLMNAIRKPKVYVDLDNTDIKRFALEIDRSSNRLAYGIIAGSLIIASALTIVTGIQPTYYNIPLISWLLLFAAIFISILLIISIIQEKGGDSKWESY